MAPAWIIGLDAVTFAGSAFETGRTRLPPAAAVAPADRIGGIGSVPGGTHLS